MQPSLAFDPNRIYPDLPGGATFPRWFGWWLRLAGKRVRGLLTNASKPFIKDFMRTTNTGNEFHGMERQKRTLLIFQGIPASGKTTCAKEMQAKEPGRWKRVNRDELRIMIDDYKFTKENEKHITSIQNYLILRFLEAGYDVILDNTSLRPNIKREMEDLTSQIFADVNIQFRQFPVDKDEAKRRNSLRTGHARVPEHVIDDMHRKYEEMFD